MPDETMETKRSGDADERAEGIARVVKAYLREGDAFLVQCDDDEVLVEEAPQARLRKERPRLYGRLLSINDQLRQRRTQVTLVLGGSGVLFCVGLHLRWWDEWLGPNTADNLKSWWFYVVVCAGLMVIGHFLYASLAKRIYRRNRDELLALLHAQGLDRDTLISLISVAPEFEKVSRQLRLDPAPIRSEG